MPSAPASAPPLPENSAGRVDLAREFVLPAISQNDVPVVHDEHQAARLAQPPGKWGGG